MLLSGIVKDLIDGHFSSSPKTTESEGLYLISNLVEDCRKGQIIDLEKSV